MVSFSQFLYIQGYLLSNFCIFKDCFMSWLKKHLALKCIISLEILLTMVKGLKSLHVDNLQSHCLPIFLQVFFVLLFTALADSRRTYVLNGNWIIDWPDTYNIAGTVIQYNRTSTNEEYLTASGPTQEDLYLMVRGM